MQDATAEGKMGEIVSQEEFLLTLKISDAFDLVMLEKAFVEKYKGKAC